MNIISPNYILTPNKLLKNLSIAYDKKIEKIAPLEELKAKFPDAQVTQLAKNSLIMPGLINSHVHIEFSANKTQLSYGDFINWLYSVIENRDELINGCGQECMQKAIDAMLDRGITTFGAISSHAMDLEACANAKQNVVFFNELIGSQAAMADALFGDFLARLDASKTVKRDGFIPAVAIHSPYSVHPILIKKALEIVKNEDLKLTAHFMESEAERNWLDESKGDFSEFFQKFLKQEHNVSDSKEFLEHFNQTPTLLTHVVKSNEQELQTIKDANHTIIHCPISNRLLGNGILNIKELNEHGIPWVIATDGLSSNYKLDLFEEMKISLFSHANAPLNDFAEQLIVAATKNAADALGLNTGEIVEGKNADMIVIDLDSELNEELAVHLILHHYNISKVFINGKLEKGEI
ncbi:aminofutalosine deaminase family hydrolase [Sulfurimonas marina]|uniref:Metal-dependent hydrolase n=1 Tax=Sulfurimonas marina TaxID=2590551 RepID=A0A7M1AW20_9BACT|nr:metal-dependent hydrolase [Sulfurimonas marina]QOP41649.1 metal-dependent hydrolase [Sulfurimonas marina]